MSDDDTTRAEIAAILDRQCAAWNAGDAAAFSTDVTDDVVFTNIVGMFSVGRAPFEGQHAHIFATFYKDSVLAQTVEHIAFVRPRCGDRRYADFGHRLWAFAAGFGSDRWRAADAD